MERLSRSALTSSRRTFGYKGLQADSSSLTPGRIRLGHVAAGQRRVCGELIVQSDRAPGPGAWSSVLPEPCWHCSEPEQ